MPAKLTRTEEALELDLSGCRGSEFTDTLAKIKALPGRRYDGKRKIWEVPAEPAIAERILHSIQPEADAEIVQWVRDSKEQAEQDLVSPLPDDDASLLIPWAYERAPWQPEAINGEPVRGLKPHQRALVANIPPRALICDDLGLGKSVMALSYISEHALRNPSDARAPKLIVCPRSVFGVWQREIDRWLGEESIIASGGAPEQRRAAIQAAVDSNGWLITNYENLRVQKEETKTKSGGTKTKWVMKEPMFADAGWGALVFDEIARLKNRKALQTRGAYKIQAPIMLGLTGTPIQNEPAELWSLLHLLWPQDHSSYWRFFEQYTDYVDGYFGKEIKGIRNPEALRFELKGRLFRRTKGQVLDLPPKIRTVIPVTLGPKQLKIYKEAEKNLWLEIEGAIQEGDQAAERFAVEASAGRSVYMIPNGAARLVRLRQVLATPALLGGPDESAKLDAVVESIEDNLNQPHVVFSEFVETCHLLAARLEKKKLIVATYTGETDSQRRTDLEDAFQRGEIDVMIGTIGAMKEGITLTASSVAHFIDRSFVPATNSQCEDRLHRIGAKNSVTILIYQANNSVDTGKIEPTNRLKESIIKTVLPQDPVKET